jgi:hypothetical protein
VERCFEDQKSEIGLDQYEGRRYLGLKRHLILSSVSYLFLARVRQEEREKKSGADRLPIAYGHGGRGPLLGLVISPSQDATAGESGEEDSVVATPQRGRSQRLHYTHPTEVAFAGNRAF